VSRGIILASKKKTFLLKGGDMLIKILERLSSKQLSGVSCRGCGKALTSNKSRIVGYGHGCARKFRAKIEHEKLEKSGQMSLFGDKSPL
jgi:hypothetical protein